MREFKVVVVGSGGVGKSALTVQFVQGHFVSSYDATIEDSYRKHIQIDGRETRVEILDTAGTEQFSGMRDLYVKSGQGFILVYSVDDPHSLRELLPIHKLIMHLKQGQQVPMVVVGNKSDLHGQRVIPTEHGRHVAREWGCSFYEASAKLNHNVSEIFTDKMRIEVGGQQVPLLDVIEALRMRDEALNKVDTAKATSPFSAPVEAAVEPLVKQWNWTFRGIRLLLLASLWLGALLWFAALWNRDSFCPYVAHPVAPQPPPQPVHQHAAEP
ncbi:unnamed protein product, partial [Mesorhabditis spiculigera]